MASEGFAYRILVVDDDPIVLQVSVLVFKSHGFEVRTAADGFQALVELRGAEPDVIVSDLTMPNMSGFELLSVVRRRFPHIPVIAISGEFDGESPAGLIADAFFTKGQYSPEELFQKIAELIERSPLRPNLSNRTEHQCGFLVALLDISSSPVPTACVRSRCPTTNRTTATTCARLPVLSAARRYGILRTYAR